METKHLRNAAPGRAKFHEVGDPVWVCWRHDVGVFLPDPGSPA